MDENWGPFISQVGGQPWTHLVYKNPEGGQMKYYTLDNVDGTEDEDNLVSLKGRQTGTGVLMRTLPSTIDFKQGNKYVVQMDHATYHEQLEAESGKHVGYNYPLEKSYFNIDVRHANGEVIESHPLKPSTITGEGFNARPSTEVLEFEVDATNETGIYLTLSRNAEGSSDARATFVLDNIRVTEVTTEPEPSVDKSNLEALVAYAESQKEKAEYEDVVDVVKELFEKTLAEAKTVLEDTKAEQSEVDAAYDALLANVHLLGFTGNTEDLELALELVKTTNTEGKTPESVQVLNDAIAKAEELAKEIPDSFIPGQFINPANPNTHRLTTGPEIYNATDGDVDIFVAGVGTGGTITGVGEYLKKRKPEVQIVAVEPDSSAVLSTGIAGVHKIQGIGAGFIPDILNTNIYDSIIRVTDEDAFSMVKDIGRTEGFLVGISSGAAVSAAIQLAKLPENA